MTIGLSGGIDSAVTAALFVDILGPDNVLLVNMPSRYNSPMTQTIAEQTAQALGANYTVIPITESCLHTSEQLTQTPIHSYHQHRDFQLTISPLIYENIQSRDRGSRVVAGLAAAFGGVEFATAPTPANMAPDMSNFATAWGFFGTLAWII